MGGVLEEEGEVGGLFFERSWVTTYFIFDEFGQTPPAVGTSPFSVVPPLREMAIADLPRV